MGSASFLSSHELTASQDAAAYHSFKHRLLSMGAYRLFSGRAIATFLNPHVDGYGLIAQYALDHISEVVFW